MGADREGRVAVWLGVVLLLCGVIVGWFCFCFLFLLFLFCLFFWGGVFVCLVGVFLFLFFVCLFCFVLGFLLLLLLFFFGGGVCSAFQKHASVSQGRKKGEREGGGRRLDWASWAEVNARGLMH